MCSNYDPSTLPQLLLDVPFEYKASCWPGYDAPVLVAADDRPDELVPVRAMFGLVPHWSKDTKISRMTYNARSETVAKLPSYRYAWKERHFCIAPASAFYEPNYETGKSVRWAIKRKDGQPFGIAAIWDRWKKPASEGEGAGEWMRSFSMVTINATDHPLMQRFHAPEDEKRSIVILPPDRYQSWLHAGSDDEARSHLMPFNADDFMAVAAPRPTKPKPSTPPES